LPNTASNATWMNKNNKEKEMKKVEDWQSN
jgi:hypothetical protein